MLESLTREATDLNINLIALMRGRVRMARSLHGLLVYREADSLRAVIEAEVASAEAALVAAVMGPEDAPCPTPIHHQKEQTHAN